MRPCTSFTMNFKTRWSTLAAVFLALSFFLRVIHFTILSNITTFGGGALFLHLILPLLLCIIGMILFRALRLRHPLIYAILGALLCIMLLIWNCSSGNVLRIVLSVIWYLVCGSALVMTALGFIPWKLPVSTAFAVALFVRLFVYDLGKIAKLGWVPEGSALCILAALFCMTRCFSEVKPTT